MSEVELVKLLREGKFARLQKSGPYPDQYAYAVDTFKTHLKAADTITRLLKERDEARARLAETKAELRRTPAGLAAAEAKVAALTKALKPFASLAVSIEVLSADMGVDKSSFARSCAWEDLEAARKALEDSR